MDGLYTILLMFVKHALSIVVDDQTLYDCRQGALFIIVVDIKTEFMSIWPQRGQMVIKLFCI